MLAARTVLYPERRVLTSPPLLPSYTTHALTAPDGDRFDVWLLEISSPRARIVICHGYSANRYQVVGIAEALRQRGYESILFELRGHGSRPGPCTLGLKETADVGAILTWSAQRDPSNPLPVGALGLSMGAAVMCQVAADYPEVRAIVTDSIYSRFFPVLRQALWERRRLPAIPWAWLMWWALQALLRRRLAAVDPIALAPNLHQPLLAIQGEEDHRAVPDLGREFYERWAGPKERWGESRVGHVEMFARHPHLYAERVANFFDRVWT
ncbi:MAG: alpha/beta fold hydrolase [Candidatus Omnitrophica bacterium]|nr:alpha/beta fold hydrolase [Candidatus Omnitrophota bacterium]